MNLPCIGFLFEEIGEIFRYFAIFTPASCHLKVPEVSILRLEVSGWFLLYEKLIVRVIDLFELI